ncbi:aminotransferase class I/II-fold pyridoxal phosphate-dependent enzyme [Candidatus Vidania fulgoroideorum]
MKKKTKIINRKKILCYKKIKSHMTPVNKFSTVYFKNFKKLEKYEKNKEITYGTHGSPNEKELAYSISLMEKGKYAVLSSSGLNSIFLCYFSFLNEGDIILVPDNLYAPNNDILIKISKKYKIKVIYFNPTYSYKEMKKKFGKIKIKIIFLENPGSITFEINNVKDIIKFKKKYNIICIIDNTFSAGITFNPLELGFDVSIQALTKYYSGNCDVIMGAAITKKKYIYNKLYDSNRIMGLRVDDFDCYLILRNILNVKSRYISHSKKATKVIKWLKKNKKISKIINPSLKKNKYFKYASGLFSVIFKNNVKKKKIEKFINSLKLFEIGYSWGGSKSLIMLYKNVLKKRSVFKKYKKRYIVRLFIGLENVKDIKKDLKNALKFLN